MFRSRTLSRALVLAVGLALAACGGSGDGGGSSGGGGGGGGGGTTSGFSGTYQQISLFHTGTTAVASVRDVTTSSTGIGNGSLNFTETFANSQGTILTPGGTSNSAYEVAANGATTISINSSGQNPPFRRGGLTSDGEVLLLSSVANGQDPIIVVMGRRQSSVATTTIQGAYATAMFDAPMSLGRAIWTTTTFDGSGGWTSTPAGVNLAGAVTTEATGESGTYNVTSDGTTTTTGGAGPAKGAMFYSGELVVLGGIDADSNPPRIQISVRKGTGTDLSTFSGEYWFVGIRTDESTGAATSTIGTATADGAGGLTYSDASENASGTVTNGGAGTDNYTVASDGTFTMTSGLRVGGISGTGRVVVVAGETSSSEDPTLILLVRK